MSTAENRFLDKLASKSKNYRRNMKAGLKVFLERYELTAEELYERQRDIEKGVALGELESYDLDWLPNLVQGLVMERVRSGLSPDYAKDVHKAVSLFCRASHLRYEQSSHDLPQAENIGKAAFNRAHIVRLWDHAEGLFKTRNRAVMAFLKDSGLRPVDLAAFTVRDYRRAVRSSPEKGYAVFNPIITSKKGIKAYPHIGPEATAAVDAYLGDESLTEYLGLSEKGPLFMSRDMDGKNGELLGFKPMNSIDISIMIKRIIEASGINNGARYGSYSFRKYHTTSLNSATDDLTLSAMPLSYIYKLQGRKVKDSFGTYDRPEENGLLTKAYVQHYPKLSIEEPTSAMKIIDLEDRITELERDLRLSEHGQDYLMSRLDQHRVPVSPGPGEDALHETMMQVTQLIAKDPAAFTKLLEKALKA